MINKILFFACMLVFIACSPLVPYTNAVKEKYHITDDEVKKIQFYTSEDIILYKKENSGNKETSKGELIVSSGVNEERLLIKKGTPCVVEKVIDRDKLALSFESGEGKYLIFGSSTANGEYKLLAESWNNGRGKLNYANQTYYASQGSGNTYIVFKLKSISKYKSRTKTLSGKKIN